MELENMYSKTEVYMQEILIKENFMGKGFLLDQTEKNMMANGNMIKCMDMEYRNKKMEILMKDFGKIIKEMDKENTYGIIMIIILVNGKIIKEMDKVNIIGLMEIFIKETGKKIKEMDME